MINLLLNVLMTIAGFVILIKCADYFVDGAASFAKNFKIPTVVIGLTIVAFGSSAPELAISFNSHLSGNTDMLFGNVIGSSISNILLILGLAVLIRPFKINGDVIKKEIPILLLVTLGFSVLFLDNLFDNSIPNTLTRSDGIVLILFFTIFVYYLIAILKNSDNSTENQEPKYKTLVSIILMILGLAGIIWSSDLIVNNAAEIAASIGISQKIISVTIISIGTSLPELITTITAAKKGENGMAIGNIVGSNIFNICIVIGLPVALLGDVSTAAFSVVDIFYMLIAVVLLWVFSAIDRDLRRYEASILIGIYATYGIYIFMQ
ncbi:MAG: calcium/sodium antiporter [Defluviitaleaceae bacterium]|nr:calcium/sodium antiporter [Defluviitaleaceae bacterium]